MKNSNQDAVTIASLQAQLNVLQAKEKQSKLSDKAEKKALQDAAKEIRNARNEVTNLFNSEFKSFSKLFRFISKNKELISKGYMVSMELLTIDNVCKAVDTLRLTKKQNAIDSINTRIVLLKAQNALLIEATQPNALEVRKLKTLNKSLLSIEAKELTEFYVPFSINTIIKGLK